MDAYHESLMKILPSDDMYNLCITNGWDPNENFTDEEHQKVENKAKELMDKAKEEFDDFIESMGFENGMGMLFRKNKQ